MRRFISHPDDIPIACRLCPKSADNQPGLRNFSAEGLSFHSAFPIQPGSLVTIRIDQVDPPFEGRVQVCWCRAIGEDYEIGASLVDDEQGFGLRMAEQLCHIEHYRRTIGDSQARALTEDEAAQEWIERYAEQFPQ